MINNSFIYKAFAIFGLFLISLNLFAQAKPAAATTPAAAPAAGGAAPDGKTLFMAKCASCHNANMRDKSTGPALGGVQGRWADPKKLYAWIRNNAAVLASGDAYANSLYNEYGKSNMTVFSNITDPEITAILGFIDNRYKNPVVVVVVNNPNGGTSGVASDPVYDMLIYGLGFLLLFALAIILARTIANLKSIATEKETGIVGRKTTFREMLTSKGFIGFLIFAGIVIGGYLTVSNAVTAGRQQGYAPDQPIRFSHKTHAGVNKIDCQYCHDGARRSKHASIPGASTCMNCHKAIKKGPKYGTEEIGKIYASAGYNPDKDVYDAPQKPIEWVRIHNLPDHVYFNHSQHVVAGKVKCQECHGKVEEMNKVEQHAPLSMGWCINCHRTKEVQFKDNKYYEAYQSYHDAMKAGKKEKVTVEDIGGLECQKCHY
ncbi:MAG: hypothetical protein RI894_1607 [Bacteroidota bacterium]